MSVAIRLRTEGLDQIDRLIEKLVDGETDELMEALGATAESQTHHRIRNEKESPDGDSWEDWSDDYTKTRHTGHSLLMSEGNLDDSIQFLVSGGEVEIGSNLLYAATHNEGDDERGMPERRYLGFSEDNEDELVSVTEAWIREVTGGFDG